VESLYPQRIVGCTGVPADSHETVWVRLEREGQRRCTSCGQGAFIFMLTSVPAQLCWPGT
jgi:cytochrome c oxidase subunit 5b